MIYNLTKLQIAWVFVFIGFPALCESMDEHETLREKYSQAIQERHWVYLGVNGELVWVTTNGPLNHISLPVTRTGDKLQILDVTDEGEKPTVRVFADINKEGKIAYTFRDKEKTKLRSRPAKWPLEEGVTNPSWPKPGSIIDVDIPSSNETNDARSHADNQDWILLGAENFLIIPEVGSKKPANCLLVVPQEDGGFTLEHSGPLHSGVYARVLESRRAYLTPIDPFDTTKELFWLYVSSRDKQEPTLPPAGHVHLVATPDDSMKILVESGRVTSAFK